MRERLLPVALACAALGLFWLLLFPKPRPPGSDVPRPLSTEAAPTGYLGLSRWLAANRIPTTAWRSRYTALDLPGVAIPQRSGNLMIVSLPFDEAARADESAALEAWVRRGNTLLVMAALDDTPRWAAMSPGNFVLQLNDVAHLAFEVIPAAGPPPKSAANRVDRTLEAVGNALRGEQLELQPAGVGGASPAMFEGVARLATFSELPASRWRGSAPDGAAVLELAHRIDTGDPALWARSWGSGTIIVCGYASPLSNAMLGEAGNARWLANLVATYLGPAGRVVFDDAHQGSVDYLDARNFFGDARLHRTLGWLVLLWAVWVFGTRALLPARSGAARVDDTALLTVTADFYAGALSPAVAGEQLCAHFFDGIRRRLQLPQDGKPVWDWLAAHGRVTAAELAELKRLHARALAGRRLDLQRLHILLHDLSGKLA